LRKKAPNAHFKFVWVGGGYEPQQDQSYSVYLHEQVKRSGLADCFTFLGEVADIQAVYDRTDVFLLTSRLDPLPNVGIDAICSGLPIFCFRDASGIADILTQEGYGNELVSPYMDTDALASLVQTHALTQELREALRQRLLGTAKRIFSMERYAESLGDEVDALIQRQG
jgi:glycosyltransferase involved in cell wall biosynthesis